MNGWSWLSGTWASCRGSPTSPSSLGFGCLCSKTAWMWCSCITLGLTAVWRAVWESCEKLSCHSGFAWELHLSHVPCQSQPRLTDWTSRLDLGPTSSPLDCNRTWLPHQTCSAPPAWVPWDGTLVSEDPFPVYLAHPGSPALAEQPAQTVWAMLALQERSSWTYSSSSGNLAAKHSIPRLYKHHLSKAYDWIQLDTQQKEHP